MLLTASQIQWTADCTKALKSMKERGDKKGLRSMKKKQASWLLIDCQIIRDIRHAYTDALTNTDKWMNVRTNGRTANGVD